jgi:CheY-like chemotaxis protein
VTPRRILVVDDEESIRTVVSFTLEHAGYEVAVSPHGDDCLEKVFTFKPDLILLDIMMPVIDGWEVLKLLKGNPETAGVPVVLLTAKGEIRDKMFALQQGATDYITKPFDKEKLLSRIAEILA